MARISLDSRPSLFSRLAGWYSRLYGSDLQPAQAALHNRRVALSYAVHEGLVARWNELDPQLGFWQFVPQGMSTERLEAVASWWPWRISARGSTALSVSLPRDSRSAASWSRGWARSLA